MLDVPLACRLVDALKDECVLLLVGDRDQLPSIGPGAVLADLLRSPRVPRVSLSTIYRQDASGDSKVTRLDDFQTLHFRVVSHEGQSVRLGGSLSLELCFQYE